MSFRTWRPRPPRKSDNSAKRLELDPLHKCYPARDPAPDVHAVSLSHQPDAGALTITFEYTHAYRWIWTDGSKHPEALDFWMGDSRGRWEGDTLVVDVANFNDQTWFDRAGNFHSEALHLIERFTPRGPDHILYEVTDRRSEGVQSAVENQSAALSAYRAQRPDARLRVPRVRRTAAELGRPAGAGFAWSPETVIAAMLLMGSPRSLL